MHPRRTSARVLGWLLLGGVLHAPALGCGGPSSSAAHSATSAPAPSASPALVAAPAPGDTLPEAPRDPREPALAEAASYLLTQQHVLRRPIDDTLSKEAFSKLIEHLDGGKVLLLEEHVNALAAYATAMDDQLAAGNLLLGRKAVALATQRRKLVADTIADILSKPLDLTNAEETETDPEKRKFARNEAELRDRWRQTLELSLLERCKEMDDLLAAQAKDPKPLDERAKSALAKIPATPQARRELAQKELAVRYAARFTRLGKVAPLEPAELFLNALVAAYDPHTQYLMPSEKANFDVALSGKLEGIGAALREQDHYIVVEELVPGGASWQQGKLQAGDVILTVAQEGKEPVDVVDMPIDEVVRMIRGPKGTVVALTVKKLDGRVETIAIQRDVVNIEATYARGAVLELGKGGGGKASAEAGYVYLPGFYGEVGRPRPGERNATSDVRALLASFEKKRLGRVVLDLRGNGGGLLNHARDISGLFIDRGPVVQTRDAAGAIEVLSDEAPGVAFSGEVVVMVDRFSASASEILAGALQDYQRAVVVGTGPTHGKGSVQAVLDLDRLARTPGPDPLGVFKLTIEQYFRVAGPSVQLLGVTPDVLLPDPAAHIESGERTLFHAIPASTIAPARFTPVAHGWVLPTIVEQSRGRVGQEARFTKVAEAGRLLTAMREDTREPLEEKAWRARQEKRKATLDAVDPKLTEGKPLLEVEPVVDPAVPAATAADPKVKKQIDDWRNGLARDPWVAEALHVLDDMSKKR